MRTLKLLIVMLLISLQVSATGYSHNMFVAQKMLKAKKEVRKAAPKTREISQAPSGAAASGVATSGVATASVVPTRMAPSSGAVVKANHNPSSDQDEVTTSSLTPAAFTQHLARWIVGFVCCEGSNDDEKASSDSEEEPSLSSHLVALVQHVVFTLV